MDAQNSLRGDSIEFEYVRAIPPTDLAPGGFVGDRFYFQGFEVPYDRSELVVVAPRGMDVLVDPRGPAPSHQVTDRGALVEHRWVARQSDRRTPEPSSVAAREFIPSVSLGAGATWERLVDALRDRLIDQDPRDPEAVTEVNGIVRGARTPTERLSRLHRWVLDNIQQEGSGTPFDLAPRMLAARSGHRTRVLCYTLNLAGVPCQLALLRPGNADATESALADDDTFQSILLRVETETGVRWVTAADHNAPLGYLPPAVAGSSGLLLAAGAPRVTVPALDLAAHGRTLTVRLQLQADGSGRGEVEEHLRGYAATGAREVLRRTDEANRTRQFEAYVGSMIAGASVDELTVTGITDREEDIVFRYRFTAPGMADLSGTRMTFDGVFHADAASTYAEAPTRTVPLWNGDPVRATLDLHLTFPEGATVEDLPASSEGHAPGVTWSVRWEREGAGLHMVRRVEVPTGRVQVGDYPTFAEVVRALDTADTRRVELRLPGR
jgi:hypothetical protein